MDLEDTFATVSGSIPRAWWKDLLRLSQEATALSVFGFGIFILVRGFYFRDDRIRYNLQNYIGFMLLHVMFFIFDHLVLLSPGPEPLFNNIYLALFGIFLFCIAVILAFDSLCFISVRNRRNPHVLNALLLLLFMGYMCHFLHVLFRDDTHILPYSTMVDNFMLIIGSLGKNIACLGSFVKSLLLIILLINNTEDHLSRPFRLHIQGPSARDPVEIEMVRHI